MFVSLRAAICTLNVFFAIYAHVAVASIIINGHKFTDLADLLVKKDNTESRERQHHTNYARPRFAVREQPTVEVYNSIIDPNRTYNVFRVSVQGDIDSSPIENEVPDDNPTDYEEYHDDDDEYDDQSHRSANIPVPKVPTNGIAVEKPKNSHSKPKDSMMESWLGFFRKDHGHADESDPLLGSSQADLSSVPRTQVVEVPPSMHEEIPTIYPSYFTRDPCTQVVWLDCNPNLPSFNYHGWPYNHRYCNPCYSTCDGAYPQFNTIY